MNRTYRAGRRIRSLALGLPAIALLAACGGSTETPPTVQPPPPAQAAASGSDAGGNPHLPLVDSRGQAAPGAAGAPAAGAAGSELTWTVPAGWVDEPPASSMRKAQYALPAAAGDAPGGECAVFYFGAGQGGDVKANVDRWAAQFADAKGAPAVPQVTETTLNGRKVLKVTAEGTYNSSTMTGGPSAARPGSMLLGAIVEGPDANWFFKCTGPKKTMEAQRPAFDRLLESVRPK